MELTEELILFLSLNTKLRYAFDELCTMLKRFLNEVSIALNHLITLKIHLPIPISIQNVYYSSH